MNPPDHPTPRTNAIAHRGYPEPAYIVEMTDLARILERELAAAQSERDLAITRVASILWSGAIDKRTCGDVQKWTEDYTAELTRLRAELASKTACYDIACGEVQRLRAEVERWELAFQEQYARAEKAEAERDALAKELGNIANAKPDTWGDMSDSFKAWAQNRARHALAAMKGTL